MNKTKIYKAHCMVHALDNTIRRDIIRILKNKDCNYFEIRKILKVSIYEHLEHLIQAEIIIKETAPDNNILYLLNGYKLNAIKKAINKFSKI